MVASGAQKFTISSDHCPRSLKIAAVLSTPRHTEDTYHVLRFCHARRVSKTVLGSGGA